MAILNIAQPAQNSNKQQIGDVTYYTLWIIFIKYINSFSEIVTYPLKMSEKGGKSPPGQSDTDPASPDPASGLLQTQSVNIETQSSKLQTKSGNLQTHSADSLSGGKPPTT